MQKLWLKDFEFNISPVTAAAAQELVQQGRVKNLREVEKHFWVALVETEDGAFETEAILTPNKIRAFTCECWSEGRRLMCAHVAASLLKVRQFLEQRAEEKQARAAAKAAAEPPRRLTVQGVLEGASADELLEFVQVYARRDRDFALALKTWFAGRHGGTENPFLLVLDAAIPKGAGKQALRDADLRRLRKTLDDLSQQLLTAASERHYRSVFQIGSALLQKITPLLPPLEENRRATLLPYLETALQQIETLNEPPELRDAVWNTLLELGIQTAIPAEIERGMVRVLSEAAADDAHFERLRAAFDQAPSPVPAFMLHLFLAALAKRGMPEACTRVLLDCRDKPATIRDAVVLLYYLHFWDAALHTGEYFLEQGIFNPAQRRELENLLLTLAEKTNDHPRLLRLLRQRFIQNGHAEVYQRLKTASGDAWPAEQQQLLLDLHQKGLYPRLAAVLATEQKTAELIQLLREHPLFDQLQLYEQLLLAADRDFVRDFYIEQLDQYLRQHFGRPGAAWVRERLAGLAGKGENDLALEIMKSLIARFPDRPNLPDELIDLLPKPLRKLLVIENNEKQPITKHES